MIEGEDSKIGPEVENINPEFIQIAEEIGTELKEQEDNLGLFIFGSVATRKATEKSDLDLVLVTKKGNEEIEPKNVRNFVRESKNVQISEVSSGQIEEDLANFVDYRILQLRQAQIIFDKENILGSLKEKAEKAEPSKEVIKEWLSNLEEDKEDLADTEDIDAFKLNSNRAALWALRIYLAAKGDFYEGGKTLEGQLQRNPEISDLFIPASGLETVNLDSKEELPPLLSDKENPWIRCAVDKLDDCQELAERGKVLSAKMMLTDAIVYYELFLQEEKGYADIGECIKKDGAFRKLISDTFQYQNKDPIFEKYQDLNNYVSRSIA